MVVKLGKEIRVGANLLAAPKGNLNLQVKLENERDIFRSDYKLPGSPDNLPYRKIWDVAFYNSKAELISLHEIAKSGPFVGVASAEKSEGVKDQFKNINYKISLHPVLEYSLELPYGRQARIWITTETACYRIMSVSANYTSYWQPFYEMGAVMMVKLVARIAKLGGKSEEETYSLLRNHRKFIHDLLKDQNLSAKIRREYNAIQSNQSTWDIDWAEHVQISEKKLAKVVKSKISSFFRPLANDESFDSPSNSSTSSIATSAPNSNTNFDETSSILSISEDESATYIEFPNEAFDHTENSEEPDIQDHLSSSFTSAQFLKWSLQEIESLSQSNYRCPLCKITFKTDGKDCISAFSVHLKAHCADFDKEFGAADTDANLENDYQHRFKKFRNELKNFMCGKLSYSPKSLIFEKKLFNCSPQIFELPFKQYSVLDSDEPVELPSYPVNPIKAMRFLETASKIVSASKPVSPVSSVNPAPKKPRAKKQAAPKIAQPENATTAISNIPAQSVNINPALINLPSTASQNTTVAPSKIPIALTLSRSVNSDTTKSESEPTKDYVTRINPDSNQTPPSINQTAQFSKSMSSSSPKLASSVARIDNILNPTAANQLNSNLITKFAPLSVPSTDQVKKQVAVAQNRQQNKSKSIINLDPEILDKNANSIDPQISKRPFSTVSPVPVPIEIIQSEDWVTPPVPSLNDIALSYSMDGKQLGCSHYKVNCKLFAECCGKWFTCRFCHDSVSDHKINRHKTRFCLCMFCGTSQRVGSRCVNLKCKALMAHYYCDKCKFWDNDSNKLIYHCDKCGICRAGLKNNYNHCDACRKCVSKTAFAGHHCEPKSPSTIKESSSSEFTQESSKNLKVVLNVSRSNSPIFDSAGKRPKLDDLQATKSIKSSSESDSKPAVDQTNYVNYLKNSLNYWRDKAPNLIPVENLPSSRNHRNCWNCLNSLPDKADGSIQNKYCVHCSAIIE